MSRVVSSQEIQKLLCKIQNYELRLFIEGSKLDHLQDQLAFARLCYKRELLGLSDEEKKEFDKLTKKIEDYQEVVLR